MSRKKFNLLEERVLNILDYHNYPKPEREYRFHPKRLWRFDFAYPDKKIAIECEGGVFVRGRHTTGIGFTADTEKYNEALKLGWKVLRYTIKNIYAIPDDLAILFHTFMAQAGEDISIGDAVKLVDGKLYRVTNG